jgi:HSP20 family molecular chaperone IbpA
MPEPVDDMLIASAQYNQTIGRNYRCIPPLLQTQERRRFRQPVKPCHVFHSESGEHSMETTGKQPKDEKNLIIIPAGVSENGRSTCIICQLHGIPEEDNRIDLEKTRLAITAPQGTGRVIRKITVPDGPWISKKKFHGGILEIVLDRLS